MKRGLQGHYETVSTVGETVKAFIPDPLPPFPADDVQEVSNYVSSMTHGLKRLEEGFPLSLRLLREIHAELLAKGRPGAAHLSEQLLSATAVATVAIAVISASAILRGILTSFLVMFRFRHECLRHSGQGGGRIPLSG